MSEDSFEDIIDRLISGISEDTRVIWPKTGYVLVNQKGMYLMAVCGQAHGLVYCRTYQVAQTYARQSGEVNTVQKVQLRKALTIAREKDVDGLVMGEHPDRCLLLEEKKPEQVFILSDVLNDIYGTYSVEKQNGEIVTGIAAFTTSELVSFARPKMFPEGSYLTIQLSLDEVMEVAVHKQINCILLVETEDLASPTIIRVNQ